MTIIEALKSGKPYRRKGSERWEKGPPNFWDAIFSAHDVIGEIWEVKEEREEIQTIARATHDSTAMDIILLDKINEIIEVLNGIQRREPSDHLREGK